MKAFHSFVASLSLIVLLGATVSAQTTWTGGVSTNWNHTGNWDTATVPGAADNVIIPSGPANQPSAYILNPECADLTIESGATLSLGGGFDLTVNGNLDLDGGLAVTSSTSEVIVSGDWMNDGSFTHGGGMVELDGTGTLGGATATAFANLNLGGSIRTISTAFSVSGDVTVSSGATIDLGTALTHSVAGNWTSSAAGIVLTGTSQIDFTGTGLLTTGGNTIPNIKVSAGTRSVNDSSVAGDLDLTGGELRILDNATLSVAGVATLTAGTLSWESLFAGNETLDVDGDVTITATAGSTSAEVRLICGGNWSSSSAFAPAAGLTIIDGGGTTTISGAGPMFANLQIVDGSRTISSATVVIGNLTLGDGVALTNTATLDVAGSFSMGNATGSWAMGASTHTVGGGFVSTGASATGTGTLELDGTGNLGTGGGSVSNVLVSAGTISVSDTDITGNLDMAGGSFDLGDDQNVTVGGNMALTAGTLSMLSSGLATPLEIIDVAGNTTITATSGSMSDNARIFCAGNWSSSGAWIPSRGLVTLDGAGANTLGGAGLTLYNLTVSSGTKTLTGTATVQNDLNVISGATLDSDASMDIDGAVALGNASASWDLGAFTHTVSGNYSSAGAAATGTGTIEFDGSGTTTTLGAASIPNVLISAGTREFATSVISGDLSMTGGGILILNNAEVDVGGNASLGTGTLAFDSGSPGTQVLDIEGDVTLTAAAGTAGADSLIQCAGNWSSSSAWASSDGSVDLDGGTTTTVSGATPTFFNLNIVSGTKTVSSAAVIAANLVVSSSATLDTDAALDVAGNVTLGDITAGWDLGAVTHTVAGSYTSTGASATGSGTIDFDGSGTLDSGSGTIANAVFSAGTRTVFTTTLLGDLSFTGGTLQLIDDQTLSVNGNADFSAGVINYPTTVDAIVDVIDVDGDVSVTATAGTMQANSRMFCGGNWTSTPAFAPSAGLFVLDGVGATTISGAGGVTLADLQLGGGTKTLLATALTVADLDVLTGTPFVTAGGVVDVNGDLTLGATSSWDLGALTHTVSGNWISSGGSAFNAGTIEFDGSGTVSTGGGSISNMLVTAGTRQVADSVVGGNVDLTAGTLRVLNNQTLTVGGNASFTGGLLAWAAAGDGTPDVIDVAGDVTVTSLAGTTTADSRLFAEGNWTSTSAFSPASGRVVLDGASPTTISGAGGVTLAELQLTGSTKTLNDSLSVQSLDILDATAFVSNAVVDVSGDVTLGAATASWALGAFTHTVTNDWISTGASATGAGEISFNGTGALDTGGGSIPNMTVTAGTRTVTDSEVTGNATMTAGTILLDADQTLTVGGNLDFSGGTISWDSVADATPESFDVAGDANVQAAVGTESSSSRLFCAGNWTSDSGFSPVSARVVLDGGTTTTVDVASTEGAPTVFFGDLQVASGTKTLLAEADTFGDVTVDAGASLVLAADLTANGMLVDGSLDIATQTVTITSNWTSDAVGASVSGTGTVDFVGLGNLTTGANTIPNMLVSAGTRGVFTSAVANALDMTAGALLMFDDQSLSVGGSATLSGGQLSFLDTSTGIEVLDVEGDMSVSASAGTMNSNSRIRCAGNWTSNASFLPADGTVVLDGAGATTLGGAGMALADLFLAAGTKTVTTAFSARDVTVANNVSWDFTGGGALTATGNVTLGDATQTLNLGGFTHSVSGDWTSAGADATNGTLSFVGSGLLSTGAATVDTVVVNGGTRTAANSAIVNDLTLAAGTLFILDDQTLSVGGNAFLTGGTLSFDPIPAGTNEILDVEGDVFCVASAGPSASSAILRCAGNWSSNADFSPSSLTVELDGAGTTSIIAVGPGFDPTFDKLVIRNGTRRLASSLPIAAANITIDSTGTLDLNGQTLTVSSSPITVHGTLSVDAGGTLALGGNAVTITATGTLSMVGAPGNEAIVTGAGGGGYFLNIDGLLAALHFRFEQMGLGGVLISSAATIDGFPNDLRAGVFSFPSATPGSVMLDIQRSSPVQFRYVDFEDPLAVGTNNVRTLSGSGAVVSFINSDGNLSGPAFELDPFEKIVWPPDDLTQLAFAGATGGADIVTLDWNSIIESDIDKYVVQRSTNSSGPFVDLGEVTPTGPGNYVFVDNSVVPKQLYFYNIAQLRTDGGVDVLAQVSATPWSAAPPPNFLTVGTTGAFPDIQTAIDSVGTTLFPVVAIEAGTYAAFTVGPGSIGTLRILSDGSGPVIIDTTLQAVEIENLGPFDSVEMSDLIIGSVGSPNAGILVSNCLGTVVLDELVVQGGTGFPGIRLDASIKVAIQRCATAGDDGLELDNGSVGIVLNGSLDDIDVQGLSDARLGGLTTASTVEAGSSLTTFTGVQSDIDAPELVSMAGLFNLDLTGEPGGIWALIFSLNIGWLDLAGPKWEMVGMADFGSGDILLTGSMGAGSLALPGGLPANGVLFGLPIALQIVVVHPGTGQRRWSNVTSIIGVN